MRLSIPAGIICKGSGKEEVFQACLTWNKRYISPCPHAHRPGYSALQAARP